MISTPTAKKQIGRLLRLPFAPGDAAELDAVTVEFRRVLSACRSDHHCLAVVDALMDRCTRIPAPADVFSAVREIQDPTAKGPMGCQECQGSGWSHIEQEAEPWPGEKYIADFSRFCACSRGRWMRSMEIERGAKAAK